MPAFHAEKTIPLALSSVDEQNYDNVIVAVAVRPNDTSTIKALQAWQGNCPVRIVHQNGSGIANARNSIIRSVVSDNYYFLDSDDILLPGTLQRYAADLSEYPGPCLRYSTCLRVKSYSDRRARRAEAPAGRSLRWLLALENFVSTCTAMVRREVFEEVGLFDERLLHAEDWDMWLRISERFPLRRVAGTAAVYRDTKALRRVPRSLLGSEEEVVRRRVAGRALRLLALGILRGRLGLYGLRDKNFWASSEQGMLTFLTDVSFVPATVGFRLLRRLVRCPHGWADNPLHDRRLDGDALPAEERDWAR